MAQRLQVSLATAPLKSRDSRGPVRKGARRNAMNFKRSYLLSTLVIATLAASACTRSTQELANATKPASRSALQRTHETARPWDDWMVIHGDKYVPVVNALG